MKKLSKTEMEVIAHEVQKQVNEFRLKSIKEKLKKDKDGINLIKKFKEYKTLNEKASKLNTELNIMKQNLYLKYDKKWSISNDHSNPNEFIVSFYNNGFDRIGLFNRIVLMQIDKDLKTDELIATLVKEYSK